MSTCPACGSNRLKPYETKPPRKHDGPCTKECFVQGLLCLNCRLWRPKNKG